MDIFDTLVIPESIINLHLLNFVLALSLVLFLPYLGFINGASIYSLIFNILGQRRRKDYFLKYSRELIGMAFFNRGIHYTLGIIPLFSILFSYIQLLHKTGGGVVSYIFFSFILFITSIILLNIYKYTYNLDNLISGVLFPRIDTAGTKEDIMDETRRFINSNLKLHKVTGSMGVILLVISTYLIIGSIQLSTDTLSLTNTSFFGVIFSLKTLLKYSVFMALSFSITSAAVLLFFMKWRGRYKYEEVDYLNFIKKFSLITSIIFTFLLPALLLLNLLFTPQLALTNSLFGYSLLAVFVLFLLIHFLYIMIKNSTIQFVPHSFYALLIIFILFVVGDQTSFATANQEQEVNLAANYDKFHQQELEKTGTVSVRSGQDIFQSICSACHRFDSKLVGPAYKNVLPKYEGKQDQLVAFILNPTKKDPGFPPMPNPGLKPAEAKAVAQYIMATYKKY